MVHFSKG